MITRPPARTERRFDDEPACPPAPAAAGPDPGSRTHPKTAVGAADPDTGAAAARPLTASARARPTTTSDGDLTPPEATEWPLTEWHTDLMTRRVILIRAVNVGGAKLPMAELRSIAADLGATDISTYIASGNLLCTPPGVASDFDRALEKAIEQRYGYFREVISRTPQQLAKALESHPFEVVDEKFSYVHFLTGPPTSDRAQALAATTFDDAQLKVIGDDLHIRYAQGAGQSKLTAATIAKVLGVQGTGRNLRTVSKLIELAKL